MDGIQVWREQANALREWLKAEDARIEQINLSHEFLEEYKLQVTVGKRDSSDPRTWYRVFLTEEQLEDQTVWPDILQMLRDLFCWLYASEPMIGLPIKVEWNGNDLSR